MVIDNYRESIEVIMLQNKCLSIKMIIRVQGVRKAVTEQIVVQPGTWEIYIT